MLWLASQNLHHVCREFTPIPRAPGSFGQDPIDRLPLILALVAPEKLGMAEGSNTYRPLHVGVPDHCDHTQPLSSAYQCNEWLVGRFQQALEVGGFGDPDRDLLVHSVAHR